jgi:2-C-methyl-D-erythritol 2,4-cyclodiphosphate synthase/2-C-methyl-D-erythritol 4-phosphate cytidylyltransferase
VIDGRRNAGRPSAGPPQAGRRVWAVVPAAGRGERFAAPGVAGPGVAAPRVAAPRVATPPKQYEAILGVTVLEWSVRRLLAEPRIAGVVVALAADDPAWPAVQRRLDDPRLHVTVGGASRQASVVNGLRHLETLAAPEDWALVHDAARPCVTSAELNALFAALDAGAQGAVLAAPVVDTVKRERDGAVAETVDRTGLWRALTPQVFPLGALRAALEAAAAAGISATDESQAMERAGVAAVLVPGSPFNIKLTRREDLSTASEILQAQSGVAADPAAGRAEMRIGNGFDAHAFGDGDHVVLGGVRIPHARGVVAHSDGDVLIHALCDALLGAIGAGDIGRHFPDTDPVHRGADSRRFLREVAARVRAAGFGLVNADLTVIAQAPRVAAHRDAMAANLAEDLGVAPGRINVKATTTEHLGFTGRGEGLAAQAAVLLEAYARSST